MFTWFTNSIRRVFLLQTENTSITHTEGGVGGQGEGAKGHNFDAVLNRSEDKVLSQHTIIDP